MNLAFSICKFLTGFPYPLYSDCLSLSSKTLSEFYVKVLLHHDYKSLDDSDDNVRYTDNDGDGDSRATTTVSAVASTTASTAKAEKIAEAAQGPQISAKTNLTN